MKVLELTRKQLENGVITYGEYRNQLRKAAKEQRETRTAVNELTEDEKIAHAKYVQRLHRRDGCPICGDYEGSDFDCPNGCFDNYR